MFFRKKPIDWPHVAGQISGYLLTLMQENVEALAQPYARFVLDKNSRVHMYFDERDPRHILGFGDIAFAFIRQDRSALERWARELKEAGDIPMFQIIATEEFAKSMITKMMNQVDV